MARRIGGTSGAGGELLQVLFWEVPVLRFRAHRLRILVLVAVLLPLFAIPGLPVRAQGGEGVATLVQVSGEVTYRPASGTWYAAWP